MKTYTHKNGNTYNVTVSKGIVNLTNPSPFIPPMQITEEEFKRLLPSFTLIVSDARSKAHIGMKINFKAERTIYFGNDDKHFTYKGVITFKKVSYDIHLTVYDNTHLESKAVLYKTGSARTKPIYLNKVQFT